MPLANAIGKCHASAETSVPIRSCWLEATSSGLPGNAARACLAWLACLYPLLTYYSDSCSAWILRCCLFQSHRKISKFHMDWRWLEVHGDLVDEKGEEVGLIRLRRTTGNSVVSNLKVPGSTTWGNPNEAIGWWRDQWHPGAPTFHPEESPSVEPPNLSHSKLLSDGFCFQLEQKPGVCMSESFSSTRQVVARSLGWFGPRHSPFSRGSSSELLNQRWTASFFFGVNGLKQHVHLSQVELQGAGRL